MKYDVLILGAGIAGSSLAYQLIRKGVKTIVIEMSEYPDGATARSGGIVTRLQDHPMDIEYAVRAIRFYLEVDKLRESIKMGYLSIEDESYAYSDYKRFKELFSDVKLLTPDDVRARWEYIRIYDDEMGIYSAYDMTIEPKVFLRILWSRLEDMGIEFIKGFTAKYLLKKDNAVYGVKLSNGMEIVADKVVSCLGAWNKLFLRMNNIKIKTYLISIPIFKYKVRPEAEIGIWDDEAYGYWRSSKEGYIIGGGYDGYVVKDPETGLHKPREYSYRLARDIFYFRFKFRESRIVDAWTVVVSFSYTHKPIFGRVKKYRNLYVIDGLGGEGLIRGPGISYEIAKELIDT